MPALLSLLLLIAFVAFVIAANRWYRHSVVTLSTYSEREYNVAGLDRSRVVGDSVMWGLMPWTYRRYRRRLDAAVEKIRLFDDESTDRP